LYLRNSKISGSSSTIKILTIFILLSLVNRA